MIKCHWENQIAVTISHKLPRRGERLIGTLEIDRYILEARNSMDPLLISHSRALGKAYCSTMFLLRSRYLLEVLPMDRNSESAGR